MSKLNNKDPHAPKNVGGQGGNMTEDVLRDAGKTEDEVTRTGAIDRADEATELLFGDKQKTTNSPVHRILWDRQRVNKFLPTPAVANPEAEATIARCIAVTQKAMAAGTLYDADGKVSEAFLHGPLAEAGYWGMRIGKEFGGQAASIRTFMGMITEMAAKADATVAGYASIHGCIGAVDPVDAFGNDEQKKYFLPRLASGKTLSAFALTEPGAGSDLTALKTTAVLDGDHYVVNGEKLFISNAICGRTVGLVVLIDGKPSVLIAELPAQESENFQIINYGIHALRNGRNNGLRFVNFRVPKTSLLDAPAGNGLIIAYHGLNYGRVALCANSSGVMRRMLRSITPSSWGAFRKTYGQSIEKRELVQRRIARLAALTVGADALVAWCSSLLDEGYRGELECIVAKVFGSEAQKEAAIEILMKTHGGRAFLHGHMFGDNVHDFLAPCIYEGEGEMLSMAFFKSVAKEHGMSYMLPLGESVKSITKKGKWFSGSASLMKHGIRYAWWRFRKMTRFSNRQSVPGMNKRLQAHVNFAMDTFAKLSVELSKSMVKHQLKLADRQCRIAHMSMRCQDTLILLVTAMYAHQMNDEVTTLAADILCQDLRRKLTGEQPSDEYFKACAKLAEKVVDGKMKQLDGVPETTVLRSYKAD